MNVKNELTFSQAIQVARKQTWVMSLICGMLLLFAIAAASRIPAYLVASDINRLVGVALFGLLALAGVIGNIRTHFRLRQMQGNCADMSLETPFLKHTI